MRSAGTLADENVEAARTIAVQEISAWKAAIAWHMTTAAKDLFVHRHTLRYRMRKVEELTGRRLSSARDRMEFFLALRARDLLATTERSAGPPPDGSRAGARAGRFPAQGR